MSAVELRDYQMESVQGTREGVAKGIRKQILMSPAGSGKTEIACYMLQEAARKFSRAMFIVDRVVLVDQTSERLDRYGIPHGVIQAGHWRWRPQERIQVCSAQTLERRGIPDGVSVVFVDEAHCMRKKVTEFLNSTNAVVIGLTATPFTKGIGAIYGGLVNVTTTNQLIARGFLSPLKIYAAKAIRTEGMKVIAGEWSEKEIEERGLEIIGDIVSEWRDKTEKHFGGPVKTICFSATVAHGEELCRQFQAAGYNFQQISYKDGGDSRRRDLIEEFRKSDSEIHGLVSCEIFTKGFDVPDVLCLAEGSRVLTHRGQIAIEELLLSDRIWDGIEFVEHDGPIFKGYQDVIEYAGLTATPQHEVLTAEGWRAFGECASEQIPIVATGFGGLPVRESEGNFSGGDMDRSRVEAEAAHPSVVRNLWQAISRFSRLAIGSAPARMSGLQEGGATSALVGRAREVAESAMRGSIAQGISRLWRSWCGVPVPFAAIWCGMGQGKLGNPGTGPEYATGPNQQRRSLRAGQSSLGIETAERVQYAPRRMGGEDASVSYQPSGSEVRRQNAAQPADVRAFGNANSGEVLPAVGQAKRRVWDVLNAGPRNRFTCEGLLVHNCGISARPYRKSLSSHIQQMGRVMRASPGKEYGLWLDHSGNAMRFYADTESVFEHGITSLDAGELDNKARKEPTEKEKKELKCSCGAMIFPGDESCPGCGKVLKRRSLTDQLPGVMVEIDGNKRNKETGWVEKSGFMAGLKQYASEHGYQSGWAAHKYKERFGVWPNDARVKNVAAAPYDYSLAQWLRSQQIKWAKRRIA